MVVTMTMLLSFSITGDGDEDDGYEDEDGEFSIKLLRCDVDELEALPGLVDADH